MDDYISREAVLSKCQQIWGNADETTEIGVAIINIVDELADFVEKIPSADAQPVKHGRWEHGECSVCGASPLDHVSGDMYVEVDYYPNYCPNCGVRMIGGDNNG